jgi:hypothetical protein
MQHQKLLVAGVVVLAIAGAVGWYLFRPELLFINKTVNEQFPGTTTARTAPSASSPTALANGRFRGLAHETDGLVTIYQLENGERTLRLTDFATSNGPDIRVYLVAAPDAKDNETVTKAGFIDLGAMKGNIGDQNYDVPAGVDLNKYRSVSVWCRRFGVNFGSAPLAPPA